jgi:hypothetical protein
LTATVSPTADLGYEIADYLAILPAAERDVLKRCSLLGWFDAALYVELTSGVSDAPDLSRLLRHPFVSEVRRRPGWYRIRDDFRRALNDMWWAAESPDSIPADLAEIATHLTAVLHGRGDAEPDELVRVELFADPAAGLEHWLGLYKQADAEFDLPRCHSLLNILVPLATASPEVAQACREYQPYLSARDLWTAEWYRSRTFFSPESSKKQIEALLEGTSERVLELRGMGGFGKTAHIDSLIARTCVPRRIPCAKLDFDALDELTATREPWLVLLELADQLSRQLPGGGFGRMVRSYAGDRTRLYRRGRPTNIEARDLATGGSVGAEEIPRLFRERLSEIPSDRPVVLILDTLEVPLHLPRTRDVPAIRPLLKMLADIKRGAPCVRVVLSGRYRIEDTISDLRKTFDGLLPTLELVQLSDEDARSYLTTKRRIRNTDHVDAAVTAAHGIPFSLALLGDMIRQDPEIPRETILDERGAEYAWLVQRVVNRISEQSVRWVLRYAAVPRRFDDEIVRDVLWPRIERERSGTGELDNPEHDKLAADPGTPWQRAGPESNADDGATVWPKLCRYASGSSWIFFDRDDSRALRLQPEVVKPLRALLRRQDERILSALHRDAAANFVLRASNEGDRDRRSELLREAVFHQFQLDPTAAGEWWAACIRESDGADIRYALAAELARGRDYVEEGGSPTRSDGAVVVPAETLQTARLELCLAAAELATIGLPPEFQAPLTDDRRRRENLNESHTLWQTATEMLDVLEQRSTRHLPEGRVALARALVAIGTGAAERVKRDDVLTASSEPGPSDRERLWLSVQYAGWLVATGSEEAPDWVEAAEKVAARTPAERELRRRLAVIKVDMHRRSGAWQEALAVCAAVEQEGLGDDEFRLLTASVRLEVCDAAGCIQQATIVAEGGSRLAPQAHLINSLAHQHRGRFIESLSSARQAVDLVNEGSEESPLASWVRGAAWIHHGQSLGGLMRAGEARAAFAAAAQLFDEVRELPGASMAHSGEAYLLMRRLGHLAGAGVALDHAMRTAPYGNDAELHALALRAELADRLRDRAEAERIVERMKRDFVEGADVTRMAGVALIALAFGSPRDRQNHAKLLADSLEAVTPAPARLRLLTGIEYCPVLKPTAASTQRLREVVIPPGGWLESVSDYEPLDRAPLLMRAATFSWVVGAGDQAELLGAAMQDLHTDYETSVPLRVLIRLARVTQASEVVARTGPTALQLALVQSEELPLLAGATVIDYLEAVRELALPIDPMEMERLCRSAASLLDDDPSNADGLRARLAELDAIVPGRDPETIRSYLEAAASIYAAVGSKDDAERLWAELGATDRQTGPDDAVVVDLRLRNGAIDGGTGGGRFLRWLRRGSSTSRDLRDVVAAWQRRGGLEPYPPELPDLIMRAPSAFRRALGQILDTANFMPGSWDMSGRDIAIRIHDGALQTLPWELGADRGASELTAAFRRTYRPSTRGGQDLRGVRALQIVLNLRSDAGLNVDGVRGPSTALAIEMSPDASLQGSSMIGQEAASSMHSARLNGMRPVVVILRPALSSDRRRSDSLERRYRLAGLEPQVVLVSHAAMLAELLRREPPPVAVHVAGTIVSTGGATAVDLSSSGFTRADQLASQVTAADLDRTLRAVPATWPSPIVVLEVPRPTGQLETLDQLLLRNCFAGDLFALGGARAVLATGLARSASRLQEVLVETLAHGYPIGDVAQSIRQNSVSRKDERREDEIAAAATAVWTDDPGLRLPAPRRS